MRLFDWVLLGDGVLLLIVALLARSVRVHQNKLRAELAQNLRAMKALAEVAGPECQKRMQEYVDLVELPPVEVTRATVNTIEIFKAISVLCLVVLIGTVLDHRVGVITIWSAAGVIITGWAWVYKRPV